MKTVVYVSIYFNGRKVVSNRAEEIDLEKNESMILNKVTNVVSPALNKRLNDRQDSKVTLDTLDKHVQEYLPRFIYNMVKVEQGNELNQVSGRQQPLTFFQYEVTTAGEEPNPTIHKRGMEKRNRKHENPTGS